MLIQDKKLGRGRFGVVYKGYNSKKNQIIAVKYVSKKMLNQLPKYERELIVLEDIAKFVHPYIMGYYGYHLDNQDGLYIFMEFC
jgi:protein-serine/threonine kinase